MPCHAMPCYATLRYVMLCYAVLCYATRAALRKVKSSITHHSLEVYVAPATTSSSLQPERKMGRHGSDSAMLF